MVDIKQLPVSEFSEDRKVALQEAGVNLQQLEKELAEVKSIMKNDEKMKYAGELLEHLSKTNITDEEKRRVLSCAYRTVNANLSSSTKKSKKKSE